MMEPLIKCVYMCVCVYIHRMLFSRITFKNCGVTDPKAESKLRWSSDSMPFFKRQAIIIFMIYEATFSLACDS